MKNKNMISIFVCMLLIAVSFSSVTALIDNNEYCLIQNDEYYTNIQQILKTCRISDNNWSQQAKLIASDGVDGDFFGQSVSIYEDVTIVGSPNSDENGEMAGAAYIFTRSGDNWVEQEKLLASDGTEGDLFGWSVSIDGDYALIGSPFNEENGRLAGSAYIFTRSSDIWTEQAKLLASDGAIDDWFGWSVSIDEDYALIGSIHDDTSNGIDSGSAYLFKRSSEIWTEQTKIIASDGDNGDIFGQSVSIDEDYALIGAHLNDDHGLASGSAYVFMRSGEVWTEQAKLLASDGAFGDRFGWSVSIDGDYALIGSPFNEENGRLAGSAYIFTRSSDIWTEQAKLLPTDAEEYDEFGQSVSINRDNALVGVYLDDDLGFASGSVYLFTRSGTNWIENTKFLPSDGMDGDWFGLSVSIDSNSILIGTPSSDDSGVDSGSAYVFKREGNQPPTAPEIDGPTNGKAGTSYDYNFTATDTDGDDVKYYIDWGDGDTEWTGFSASGTPVIVSHTWAEKDTYTITAKAQDEYGLESDWATLEVEMPVNQQVINPLLQMILERFPNAFPILRHMLGL